MTTLYDDIKLTLAQVITIHEKMQALQVKSIELEQNIDKYTHLYIIMRGECFHLSKSGKLTGPLYER